MRVYMKRNETNIRNFVPFREETISGYRIGKTYYIDSYRTTIALYSFTTDTWYLTTERFSATTATQQSALRLILSESTVEFLDAKDFYRLIRTSIVSA